MKKKRKNYNYKEETICYSITLEVHSQKIYDEYK